MFTSFEGDPALLSEGYRSYLEQHFAADEFEDDRPPWSELDTSLEDLQSVGATDKELRLVWKSMPRGKAGGADDVTREAIDSCPEALDDLLHLTAACIQQGKFPPTVALVLFVLIYKGTGDINDLSRSRAIGLQTLVLKMACGWLTLTRLSPLIATNLPRTQTAYQRHLSVESNIMWATQVIGHVLALGRSAVLPLIDASGAFDSLSHRYIDDMMKRQKVDDKGRSIFRAVVTAVRGLVRVRMPGGDVCYSDQFRLGGGTIQGGKESPDIWILAFACLLRDADVARFPSGGIGERFPNLDGLRCFQCRQPEPMVRSYRYTKDDGVGKDADGNRQLQQASLHRVRIESFPSICGSTYRITLPAFSTVRAQLF